MKTSREPKLPGLPRTEPDDDADTGVVELPWEKPESDNADSFKEREEEAVEALGDPQVSTTLRGAPDTVKLGAQTWKPPTKAAPAMLEVQDTVKLSAQTWQPPEQDAPLDDEEEEKTDVSTLKPTPGPIVSEDDAEVAGVIRADDGPARITSHPPDDPDTPIPDEVPRSIEVSPSVSFPRFDPNADVTPLPRPMGSVAETTPLPAVRSEATPIPYEPTPLPQAPVEPRRRPDPTTLINNPTPRRSTGLIVVTALISAMLGLGAGYLLWGMKAGGGQALSAAPTDTDTDTDSNGASTTEANAPAAEPQPVNETCKLVVESKPEGALVRIGELTLGKTPIDAELSCDGEIRVRISKRRFVSAVEKVSLVAGKPATVSVELVRPTYKVTIRSVPRGAKVAVNGKTSGKTPTTLELPGFEKAAIEVSKKGYKTFKKTLTPRRRRTVLKPRLRRGR